MRQRLQHEVGRLWVLKINQIDQVRLQLVGPIHIDDLLIQESKGKSLFAKLTSECLHNVCRDVVLIGLLHALVQPLFLTVDMHVLHCACALTQLDERVIADWLSVTDLADELVVVVNLQLVLDDRLGNSKCFDVLNLIFHKGVLICHSYGDSKAEPAYAQDVIVLELVESIHV